MDPVPKRRVVRRPVKTRRAVSSAPGAERSRAAPVSRAWTGYAAAAVIAGGLTAVLIAPRSRPASSETPYGAPAVVGAEDALPADLASGLSTGPAAVREGDWHFDHQQWPAAAEAYEKALRIGVTTADVQTDLGSAYRFSGQPQKAIAAYQAAQQLNPRHEQSLFNLASVYAFDLHVTPKAVSLWREYLRRFPAGQSVREVRQFLASALSANGSPLSRPTSPSAAGVVPPGRS
jgi:tetratricopeptide (TPR) repeat protein